MHFLMANFLLVEPSSVLTSHNAFKLHGLLCTPCPTSFNCYATLKRATLSTHIRTVVFQVPISEVARGTLWHFSGTAAFIVQFAFLRPFLHTHRVCWWPTFRKGWRRERELDLLGELLLASFTFLFDFICSWPSRFCWKRSQEFCQEKSPFQIFGRLF